MHIEPGWIAEPKIQWAWAALAAVVARHAWPLLRDPSQVLRAVLAAVFFTVCMQIAHTKVGPSELHFIAALPIYLSFGFLPTLFGFILGLVFQGLVFEPQDLVHLPVNSLSLVLPLIAMHWMRGREVLAQGLGRRLGAAAREVAGLDAMYYLGVTAMVGFWLSIGNTVTPLADFARFALSYSLWIVVEPVLTATVLLAVKGLPQGWRDSRVLRACLRPAQAH